ncbi:CocE/NonD family hydrolase [Pseudonocardia sp. TRM90224]|uniref:CocE/NonD family hydrolase n=1 Tax=Pseudonocardia sp. TRM90224 TaxID=2812678 RepID=UPI001E40AE52|nr:CocE/NonD family hydrolase [Pseudonocardia sp. TRM90224]
MSTLPITPTPPTGAGRAVDRLMTRLLKLPAARTEYTRADERVPMRDGVVLAAHHYAPETAHPLGTVLIRTPYGLAGPTNLTSGRMLAARGYHVVVQSCRGTFDSGGEFDPMAADAEDAADTVGWLREQPWFDGRFATLGPSYLGWTQWALMADPPPELRAAVVVVGPHDFADVVYGSGAFTLNDFLAWADLISHQKGMSTSTRLLQAMAGNKRLTAAYAGLPLGSAAELALEGKAPWYREWVAHPELADPYWTARRAPLDKADVPVLLVGGWQDIFIRQTLQQYTTLHERGVDVAMTVGPWVHIDTATKAAGMLARETLGWFDEHLAGATGRTRPTPVRIHVTGAGEWRNLPSWPPETLTSSRWLRPHHALGTAAPADATGPLAQFHYDPADPTPTVGGPLLARGAGVRDNKPLEARPDVVAFTTEPLATAVEVIGTPVVELEHSTDNPYADVFVRLCDVDVSGRSRNVSDALLRLDPAHPAGERRTVRIQLGPCAHRFQPGHRMRLLVAGGSHPRWARNTGTGEPPADATTLRPSNQTIHAGRLDLPTTP